MKTILLVEDEPILRKSLVRFLERRCYGVLATGDLEEACSYLDREPIDILITDLVLPIGTGFDLLEEAKKRRGGLRTIVITAYGSPQVREKLVGLGVIGCLDKPFKLEVLGFLVEEALSDQGPEGPSLSNGDLDV